MEEEESSEHNLMNPAAVISCHNKLYIVYWIHELDSILITWLRHLFTTWLEVKYTYEIFQFTFLFCKHCKIPDVYY